MTMMPMPQGSFFSKMMGQSKMPMQQNQTNPKMDQGMGNFNGNMMQNMGNAASSVGGSIGPSQNFMKQKGFGGFGGAMFGGIGKAFGGIFGKKKPNLGMGGMQPNNLRQLLTGITGQSGMGQSDPYRPLPIYGPGSKTDLEIKARTGKSFYDDQPQQEMPVGMEGMPQEIPQQGMPQQGFGQSIGPSMDIGQLIGSIAGKSKRQPENGMFGMFGG